jgi:hypothetical protein
MNRRIAYGYIQLDFGYRFGLSASQSSIRQRFVETAAQFNHPVLQG